MVTKSASVPDAPWENRFTSLESSVQKHQDRVDEDIKAVASEVRKTADNLRHDFGLAFDRLNSKIDAQSATMSERGRTNWLPIFSGAAVIITVLSLFGNQALKPVTEGQSKLEAGLSKLTDSMLLMKDYNATTFVTRTDLDARAERGREDRDRVTREIAEVRADVKGIVSRAEHQERWRAIDNQFADLQRQVDEVKRQQGDVYTARDAILDLKQRLDRIDEARVRP